MLGNIKIYFGKIVNVLDESKLYRVQVSIKGYTDQIEPDKLPWYFPWYGLEYLPLVDDIVPVIIFDDNFVTGFYNKKLYNQTSEISDDDYENYLEIFKRVVNDKEVVLTYTVTEGIIFQNDKTKINLTPEFIAITFDNWGIKVEKDKINLGENGQATLLGDDTVKELQDIIKHQSNMLTEIVKVFVQIASVSTTPFTAPQGAAISGLVPAMQSKLVAENKKLETASKKLQSKKTFIE